MTFNVGRLLGRTQVKRLNDLLRLRHRADPNPSARARADLDHVFADLFDQLSRRYTSVKSAAANALVRLQRDAFDFYEVALGGRTPDVARLERILRDMDVEMDRLSRAADEIAGSGPKLDPAPLTPRRHESGRFDLSSQSDIDALKAQLPRAPADADPALAADYDRYVQRNIRDAERRLAKGQGPDDGPLDFEGYQTSREHFAFGAQGKGFQRDRAASLEAQHPDPARVDIDIGLKKDRVPGGLPEGRSRTKFGDVAVFTPPDDLRIETHKQRDFTDPSATKAMIKAVRADAREAVSKYAGTVEVRRPDHPLFGSKIVLKEVTLVYDGRLVPQTPEAVRKKIVEEVADAAAEVFRTLKVKVVFWP